MAKVVIELFDGEVSLVSNESNILVEVIDFDFGRSIVDDIELYGDEEPEGLERTDDGSAFMRVTIS